MKYYYLYNLNEKKPVNAGYLQNKLALYTNLDSAKRGLFQAKKYNYAKYELEIREIKIK
ncbi:hypothetical protein Q6294_30515 [Klebsiella pneumoniae]|uniref:Uncharacterized protein n=1 Tax=Klebsiella pneumoniae TaxID=573 RepID=A0AAW8APZ5_KLEPN|nr:hypothetical protein [Klebsiella pneumoniae]MDP0971278.1 hypothetical protein [Klebsiella pneumoniae]